jgi:hypothetical protein
MGRVTQGPLRGELVGVARRLAADARSARAELDLHHRDREFFLGVEAAADEVVRPELGATRGDDWPGSRAPAFREGYLKAHAALAAVMAADQLPARLMLPLPSRR